MSDARGKRARLTVLTGFLGAGKTTWLRHHLQFGVFQDAFVVVNEAAARPFDDALLSNAKNLAVISGGCACCERKPELIAVLRNLCEQLALAATKGEPLQRIVIETSGLADPFPIVEAIRGDPTLSQIIEIGEVITIIDARAGLDLLGKEALARGQIIFADCVIVSKLDDVGEDAVISLLESLQALNPRAALFGADRGTEAALPAVDSIKAERLPAFSDDERRRLIPVELDIAATSWPVFSVWLSALMYARGHDVLRVKGVVRTSTGRLLVQAVQGRIAAPEVMPEPSDEGDGTIVLIGRGFTSEDLRQSLHAFSSAASALE